MVLYVCLSCQKTSFYLYAGKKKKRSESYSRTLGSKKPWTTLVSRETQIRTMKCNSILTRMAIVKKMGDDKCW